LSKRLNFCLLTEGDYESHTYRTILEFCEHFEISALNIYRNDLFRTPLRVCSLCWS